MNLKQKFSLTEIDVIQTNVIAHRLHILADIQHEFMMLMNLIDYLKKIINGIRLHIQITDIIQKGFKLTNNLQNGILEAGDKMNLQIIILPT